MTILAYVGIMIFVMQFRAVILAFNLIKAVLHKETLVIAIFLLTLMHLMIIRGIKTARDLTVITLIMTLMIFLAIMGNIILMTVFYLANILAIFDITFIFTEMLFIFT